MMTSLRILVFSLFIIPILAGESVFFGWEEVKGATSYNVEVSLEKDFKKVLEKWNVLNLTVEYVPEKPGHYYFRVTPLFNDLVLKESSSIGELDVRYEAPKIKYSDDEIRWQRVPRAEKYIVKIKSNQGEEVLEVKDTKIKKSLLKADSQLEVIAMNIDSAPISTSSFSEVMISSKPVNESVQNRSDLPLRYIALFTGFGQYKLDSTLVENVSKNGLLNAFEASWSRGFTHNFAMRITAINNQITRDTLLVPEVSYNYEFGKKGSLLHYIGLALKRESISLIAGNNYLGIDYLYYGTKIIGHLGSRLSYQLDLEHTGGILGFSQFYFDFQISRFHLYLKLFNQSVTIESPSSGTESEFSSQGVFLGLGTDF